MSYICFQIFNLTEIFSDISETGNGRKLANQYCSFGLPCVDKVVKTMRNCAKKDADFWEKSALKIEEKINSDMVQNLITQMTADMDEGSFKSLIEMVCGYNLHCL